MPECPRCQGEVKKATKGVDGRFRHSGENSCGGVISSDLVENHRNEIEVEVKEPEPETTRGTIQISGLEDGHSKRVKKKAKRTIEWINSAPLGIDPTSKGSKYCIRQLQDDPEIADDPYELQGLLTEATSVKSRPLRNLLKKLRKIDERYGGSKRTTVETRGEDSTLADKIDELSKKIEEKEEDDMDRALKMMKTKAYEKADRTLDRLQPFLTAIEAISEQVKNDPETKRLFFEAFGIDIKDLLRKMAEKRKEKEETKEKESPISKLDLDKPPEKMSDEELEELESKELEPDLKAQVAQIKTERKMEEEEEGEEEILDELPDKEETLDEIPEDV